MTSLAQNIVNAFDKAAAHYDGASLLQQQVAQQLIDGIPDISPRNILDIGCGTGHVTALAAARWPNARITAFDASPQMLAEAQKKLPQIEMIQGDAADIKTSAAYDLIVSSMLLHWLPEPGAILRRWQSLLSPNGHMFVALPVAGSLREWRDLCAAYGITDGLWPFPDKSFATGTRHLRQHSVIYAALRDFLNSMKQTGAHTAAPAHSPLPTPVLRQMLRENRRPFKATYDILYIAVS